MSDDYDDLRRQVKAATPAEQVESLERLINLLLRHGVSFQQIQRALPRKEDGRPMSLAGEIIDALVRRTTSRRQGHHPSSFDHQKTSR
jgi:hypothetical protein